MSADIEKLWHLYFGSKDDEFQDESEDVYTPGDPRVAAIETFADMFMNVRADNL